MAVCSGKKEQKQAAVCSSVGAIATYIFATYFINIAGLNAVVWGLLVGGILYFGIGMVTGRKGLGPGYFGSNVFNKSLRSFDTLIK